MGSKPDSWGKQQPWIVYPGTADVKLSGTEACVLATSQGECQGIGDNCCEWDNECYGVKEVCNVAPGWVATGPGGAAQLIELPSNLRPVLAALGYDVNNAQSETAWQTWAALRPEQRDSWKDMKVETRALWRKLGFHEGNWNGQGGAGMEIESWSTMELQNFFHFFEAKDRFYMLQVTRMHVPVIASVSARAQSVSYLRQPLAPPPLTAPSLSLLAE